MAQPVRLWFKKYGKAKFISHLDLNRTMIRAVRMAGIPIWYTEGFNKHPYITFPAPLSIFVSGENEPMDFKITDSIKFTEIRNRMNKVLPQGIEVIKVSEPVMKVSMIHWAQYKIELLFENCSSMETYEILQSCKNAANLNIEKKTKKGSKIIDVKQYFMNADICYNQTNTVIDIILPCGSTDNINPSLILDAVQDYSDRKFQYTNITRLMLLNDKMEQFQ